MKAFINGKIETISAGMIEDGVILVENGKILEVGSDLTIPPEAEVIDVEGKYVTPGLIDAHTHIGAFEQGVPESFTDGNEMTSPITPQLRIIDSITPQDSAFEDALSGGVTCVQTLPGSANVIGGQGAVIKTHGTVVDEMIVLAPSSMKAALGENPIGVYKEKKVLPTTRMGNAACMRDALIKVQNYIEKEMEASEKDKLHERDLTWESLVPVLEGEIPLSIHAHRADDIATAVRISEEFGLSYTIEHCTEGHLLAEYLGKKHLRAAVGPTLTSKPKLELRNKSWDTLKKLLDAGCHVCIITDHPVIPVEHLALCASLAYRAGLTREDALKCITLYAAEHLGLENRLGSIEKGKDADLAIWDGDPLDSRSSVVMTMIEGEVVYQGSEKGSNT